MITIITIGWSFRFPSVIAFWSTSYRTVDINEANNDDNGDMISFKIQDLTMIDDGDDGDLLVVHNFIYLIFYHVYSNDDHHIVQCWG